MPNPNYADAAGNFVTRVDIFYQDLNGQMVPVSVANPIPVTAGRPAAGQTAKQVAGTVSINTGATVPINTVTAGKTFYITDIHLATDASAASVDAKIQAAGVTIFETFLNSTAPCDMVGIETQPSASSGQAVTLVLPTVAGKNVNYFISGVES